MKKLFLWSLVLVVVISMLLAGVSCKNAEEAAEETAPAEEEVAEEAAPAEEEAAVEPVEILVWAISQDMYRPWFDRIFSEFNDAYEDIQIVPEYKDTKALDQLLVTATAAKEGPDLFYCIAGPVQAGLARSGELLALNDYYPEDQMETALRTDFCEVDGKNYAMPSGIFIDAIQYRKDIFEEAGLDPDNFPESSWEEFTDACDKIKAIGVSPFGFTNKEGWYLIFLMEGLTVQNFDSNVEVWDLVFGPDGTFTEPRFLEGLKYVKELYDKGYLLEGGMSEPYELLPAQIIAGDAAMTRGHERFYTNVKNELGDITGRANFPIWADGELAGKLRSAVNGAWYAVKYTEHPEETVKVLAELTDRENNNINYEMLGALPATTNWDSSLIDDPNIQSMVDRAAADGTAVYYVDIVPSGAVLEAIKKNLPLYVMGEITGQEWGERVDAARE